MHFFKSMTIVSLVMPNCLLDMKIVAICSYVVAAELGPLVVQRKLNRISVLSQPISQSPTVPADLTEQ